MNNSLTEQDKDLISEFSSLSDNYWDFKNEDTRCYTHGIHGYPAVMVAPISRNLIRIAKKHQEINSILDPFMGSGSVLIESQVANINNIYGVDLNPLAKLLSKVRTTKLSEKQLYQIENNFIKKLNNEFDKYNDKINNFNHFIVDEKKLDITEKKGWGYETEIYFQEYKQKYCDGFIFPTFKNIGFWFTPKTIYSLQIIKNVINMSKQKDIRDFLLITFSETIRKVSNTKKGEFKLVRISKEQILKNTTNTKNEFLTILEKNISKMREFVKILENSNSNVKIISGDTRNIKSIKSIPDNSIDLVITSPPYGDSQTTVAYGQYSRLSLQWLDLEISDDIDIKTLDKSLLGGIPYKDKTQWSFLQSKTLVNSLTKIANVDPLRANDVFSFYIDLDKCIYGITKKMKTGGYQYWVVGNRTVKGENLRTDKIITEMAEKYGLNYIYTFGRNIINKSMPSQNSPTNETGKRVATMTKEIIVVLKKVEN